MDNKWTNEELNKAIKLFKEGENYKIISQNLNRSEKSIKLKLNRLGYIRNDYKPITKVNKECLQCKKDFISIINHNRKFCSSSCSATFNNLLKGANKTPMEKRVLTKTGKKKKDIYQTMCLLCQKELYNRRRGNKYCDNKCQSEYERQLLFLKIENGDTSLNSRHYKKYLIHKYGEHCMICGWNERHPLTNKVPIELEHIDGNSENNSLENLKLLCPNHHSLTLTYKALNTGNGRYSRRERYKENKSY